MDALDQCSFFVEGDGRNKSHEVFEQPGWHRHVHRLRKAGAGPTVSKVSFGSGKVISGQGWRHTSSRQSGDFFVAPAMHHAVGRWGSKRQVLARPQGPSLQAFNGLPGLAYWSLRIQESRLQVLHDKLKP